MEVWPSDVQPSYPHARHGRRPNREYDLASHRHRRSARRPRLGHPQRHSKHPNALGVDVDRARRDDRRGGSDSNRGIAIGAGDGIRTSTAPSGSVSYRKD